MYLTSCRQEFAKLMEALNGGSSASGLTNGLPSTGLMRSGSFGSSRTSTPSPTMGESARGVHKPDKELLGGS